MFQRRFTLVALLPLLLVAFFLTFLLIAFYILPTMSSTRVILAVDFEVKGRKVSVSFVIYRIVIIGIWASARGVLPIVHTSTGHISRPQRLGEKYKVGGSQHQKILLLLSFQDFCSGHRLWLDNLRVRAKWLSKCRQEVTKFTSLATFQYGMQSFSNYDLLDRFGSKKRALPSPG